MTNERHKQKWKKEKHAKKNTEEKYLRDLKRLKDTSKRDKRQTECGEKGQTKIKVKNMREK